MFATVARLSSIGSLRSSQTMSGRGTISDEICRSSSRNTLRTIACSLCSMTPVCEPSASIAWISSSVTEGPASRFAPISLSSSSVDFESSQTKGLEASDRKVIGRATKRAMPSGLNCPSRLGTSSPTTIDT